MKIFQCPNEIPFPEPDYKNYDPDKEQAREKKHQEFLLNWLLKNGFTGEMTGEIFRSPMADGYALYMFADGGEETCLIHLPYGDAWHDKNVEFLSVKEVIRKIKNLHNHSLFG